MFIRFDASHERDRQTDRRTLHDSKYRAYASHRAVKRLSSFLSLGGTTTPLTKQANNYGLDKKQLKYAKVCIQWLTVGLYTTGMSYQQSGSVYCGAPNSTDRNGEWCTQNDATSSVQDKQKPGEWKHGGARLTTLPD